MTVTIGTDTTITSGVTVTAGQGTMNTAFTSQTLAASTSVEFVYSLQTNKWYRLR